MLNWSCCARKGWNLVVFWRSSRPHIKFFCFCTCFFLLCGKLLIVMMMKYTKRKHSKGASRCLLALKGENDCEKIRFSQFFMIMLFMRTLCNNWLVPISHRNGDFWVKTWRKRGCSRYFSCPCLTIQTTIYLPGKLSSKEKCRDQT